MLSSVLLKYKEVYRFFINAYTHTAATATAAVASYKKTYSNPNTFFPKTHFLILFLQRCMESSAELNQQMIFAIRAVLKPARDTRVSLNAFLNFSTPHLLRAPEEYIAGKYAVNVTYDAMILIT